MGIEFKFFKALAGDSILVSTDKTNILIDGGYGITYEEEIQPKLNKIKNGLHLVVLTHIDADHICGLIEMIKEDRKNTKKIKKLWFNSTRSIRARKNRNTPISYRQADTFDKLLVTYNVSTKSDISLDNEKEEKKYCINGEIVLQLLSPYEDALITLEEKEPKNKDPLECNKYKATQVATHVKFGKDKRPPNNSSIAFIMRYERRKFLFLADANIETIYKSLMSLGYSEENKLKVEFVKLSHHGSLENINEDFLKIIETDKFIILTDGKSYAHPSKEIFPLIIKHQQKNIDIEFIFNYEGIKNRKLQEAKDNHVDLSKCSFNILPHNILEFG